MSDPINPYQAPVAAEAVPAAREFLPEWQRVGRGLTFNYYAIVILIVGALAGGVAGGLNAGNRDADPSGIIAMLTITLWATVIILDFTGLFLCLAVPSASRAKPMLLGTIVTLAAWLPLFLAGIAMRGLSPPPLLAAAMLALRLASGVFFTLFLWRIGLHIARQDFADRAKRVVIVGAVFAAAAGAVYLAQKSREWPPIFFGIWLILILGSLIPFVMYANLINDTRKVLLGQAPATK